jgi:flagellar biogenesis protein FliO
MQRADELYLKTPLQEISSAKGETTMPYALSELIFCVWCLPVTIFIIIPLVMLAGWWIKKLVSKENTTQTA